MAPTSDLAATPDSEVTSHLADFAIETSYEDLPDDVVERVRRHVIDEIGCILYGSTLPWIQQIGRAFENLGEANDVGAEGTATIIGRSVSTTPRTAVLLNGTAGHALDYDDHCQDAGVHAGSATIPAALAFSETTGRNVTGEEFLTAVAVGDEIGIRSGYGIGFGSLRGGLHIAGWTGAFAGAATTGKLWGLDHDQFGHALGLAGTQGCGLTGAHSSGADVKRFHMGKAAESGYIAAALADQSFTGDRRIFDDRHGGIGRTMTNNFDLDQVTDGLGDTYRIMDKLSFKTFPSIGMIHAQVDAVHEILGDHGLETGDVDHVVVGVGEIIKSHVGWDYEPTGVMAAQSNTQYAIATYLEDGEITVDSYTDQAIRRPNVVERTNDVEVVVDEEINDLNPGSFGATVRLTTRSGETYTNTVMSPRGFPENPIPDDDLLEKFRNQAGYVLGADEIDRLLTILLNIEEQDDVGELIDILST